VIGRERELAAIDQGLSRVGAGDGQVLVLAGDAGVGKSRLVAEARQQAQRRGFRLLEGRCFESDAAVPFGPLIDLLQTRLDGMPPEELVAEFGAVVPELSRLLPELTALVPEAAPPPPSDFAAEKHRLFRALTRFIVGPAGARPALVVVEDLHWSDAASLEFLLAFVRRVAAQRVLVLLSYRSDEVGPNLRHFLAELDRGRLARELTLSPLDRAEVAAMLRAIFGPDRRVRADAVAGLVALTDGNPFFIEEVLSAATPADSSDARGSSDRAFRDAVHVPRSVLDAVARRLVRLSPPAQRVLTLAAVAGQRFDLTLLRDLTQSEDAELLDRIKELVAAQLVVEESAERFAFRHALTRQAVSAQLLARERQELHRRIVETIERLWGESEETHLPDLAYHARAAGLWGKSLAYSRRMADRGRAMHASQAAVEYFGYALEAARHLGLPPPLELHRARGQAYELRGEFERAQDDFTRALSLAQESADRDAEWQGLLDLGFLWLGRDYPQAGDFFRRALALAEELGDPNRLAQSLNRLGNWYVNLDEPAEGQALHRRALAILEGLDDRPGIAETRNLLALATYFRGDRRGAVAHFEDAADHFRALDERRGLASVLAALAHLRCPSPVYATLAGATPSAGPALREGEEAVALARSIGWRSGEAYALSELAACYLAAGDFGGALAAARAGLAIAEEIEHQHWQAIAESILGLIYLDLLDYPEACRHAERGYALARETGSRFSTQLSGAFAAAAYVLGQEQARAEALLRDLVAPEAPIATLAQSAALMVFAGATLARGEPSVAREIADRLIAWTSQTGRAEVVPHLWLLRGKALAELDETAEAELALRAALDTAREQEARPLLWRIQVALGKLLRARGRRDEAERAYAAARVTIDELAATVPDEALREGFRERALAQLPPTRPTPFRQIEKQHYGGLTTREREIAALIARGRSNREIAEALVVSERTVEAHTGHIRDKLGFTSRAQVAAWAVEHGLAEATE
jgi:DNA-binding CsgD family transcriptional regulator